MVFTSSPIENIPAVSSITTKLRSPAWVAASAPASPL